MAADGGTLAAAAAFSLVLLAILGGAASYFDNYFTENVGQWVAYDLRIRVYDHLEHLSFRYYDTHQTGVLLSTATDDVSTIQDFVSSSTLSILIDLVTVAVMLVLMFWLNWDFALMVTAVTPFLFVARFRRAVKKATREVRRRESDIVAVLETGLETVRTVQALGAEAVEAARLEDVSQATVRAALSARRIKSFLPPLVSVIVFRMYRVGDLAGSRTRSRGGDDSWLTDRLPRLSRQVLQTGAGTREDDERRCARQRCP